MDEWLGVLFIIGCFVMSFVMELKKKRKALNGELSEPANQDPDVTTMERAHRVPSPIANSSQRNSATNNTVNTATKPAISRPNSQSEETADETSLEEIKNAVIWSEILNRKYT